MKIIINLFSYFFKLSVILYYKIIITARHIKVPYSIGKWSILHDDIIALDNEIKRYLQNKHINILEFGSGISTFTIFSIINNRFKTNYNFYSIESNFNLTSEINEKLKNSISSGNFLTINCDYKENTHGKQFDLDKLPNTVTNTKFDIIFIDAPPDSNGEDIRLDLCNQVIKFLNNKGTLILHDTNRINEMFAHCVLSKKFLLADRINTSKGISIFRFPIA